ICISLARVRPDEGCLETPRATSGRLTQFNCAKGDLDDDKGGRCSCVEYCSSACILTSCDTPVGQSAAWGAATGAIIGGAATGHVRAASIGAAAGAAAGALTGAMIQENQAARYGPPPPGGFPYACWAGTPGFYYSPYTGRFYDFRGVHPGAL